MKLRMEPSECEYTLYDGQTVRGKIYKVGEKFCFDPEISKYCFTASMLREIAYFIEERFGK